MIRGHSPPRQQGFEKTLARAAGYSLQMRPIRVDAEKKPGRKRGTLMKTPIFPETSLDERGAPVES
jgi:hypothetical protein